MKDEEFTEKMKSGKWILIEFNDFERWQYSLSTTEQILINKCEFAERFFFVGTTWKCGAYIFCFAKKKDFFLLRIYQKIFIVYIYMLTNVFRRGFDNYTHSDRQCVRIRSKLATNAVR